MFFVYHYADAHLADINILSMLVYGQNHFIKFQNLNISLK